MRSAKQNSKNVRRKNRGEKNERRGKTIQRKPDQFDFFKRNVRRNYATEQL